MKLHIYAHVLIFGEFSTKQLLCFHLSCIYLYHNCMVKSFKGWYNWESRELDSRGFPGGAVVESPPADVGDTGSCPGLGRSHVPRRGWARRPWPLSLRVRSLCSATGEATSVRGPRTTKKKKDGGVGRCRVSVSPQLGRLLAAWGNLMPKETGGTPK